MGCNCAQKGNVYTIKPEADCIFCANKHVSIAYTEFCKFGMVAGNIQVVLGELELASFHLIREYGSLASELLSLEGKISKRMSVSSSDWKPFLASLNTELEQALKDREAGIERQTSGNSGFEPSIEDKTDVFLAEREFSSAWRLATECGYADVNRFLIIGQISASQLHVYRAKCSIAEELRDLRHLISDKKEDLVEFWWLKIARKFDELINQELSK